MLRVISQIKNNFTLVIPIMMLAGFAVGITVDAQPLKQLILPLTFLMVYPMMVNLQPKKIFEGGDLKVQLVTQIMNFTIIPLGAFFIGRIAFPHSPYMALGLLLASLLPPSGMTISWTGMAKGNMAAAVKMTVFGLLLGSILTPIYIKFLMGTTIEIPLVKIFKQILIVVFLPLVLGNLTQRYLIRRYGMAHYQKDLKSIIPSFSTLGVVGIVFVAMAAFGKEGSEIALIIALAYIIQVQSAAWYVKFTDRIFGPATEPIAKMKRAHEYKAVILNEKGELSAVVTSEELMTRLQGVSK